MAPVISATLMAFVIRTLAQGEEKPFGPSRQEAMGAESFGIAPKCHPVLRSIGQADVVSKSSLKLCRPVFRSKLAHPRAAGGEAGPCQ